MSKAAEGSPYVAPIVDGNKQIFRIFLSSCVTEECQPLWDRALAAISQLKNGALLQKVVDLQVSDYRNTAAGVGHAAQTDVTQQTGSVRSHQIVVGFAAQRLGKHAEEEMREALQPEEPRPFTLFLVERQDGNFGVRDKPRRDARNRLCDFVNEVEKTYDGLFHEFKDLDDFQKVLADELRKYLERYVKVSVPPAAPRRMEPWPPEKSPYPGFVSMKYQNRAEFFGRDDKIEELSRKIEAGQKVLCVSGASGIGKSSLLMAGILPALVEGKAKAELVVDLSKGRDSQGSIDPFLATALALIDAYPNGACPDARQLAAQLRHGGLIERAQELKAIPARPEIVLCLDQAEYLVTRCSSELARAFVAALRRDVERNVTLLFTMRQDAQDLLDAQHLSDLRALMNGNTHYLGKLTRQNIVRAIREPALRAGYDIDSDLIADLADQSFGEPNPLPLLAASLRDIHDGWYARWQAAPEGERPPRRFTRDLFSDFKGAVDRFAARALNSVDDEARSALDRLFWKIVRVDITSGQAIAIRLPRSEFEGDKSLTALIHGMIEQRLLIAEGDGVAIVHSGVLTFWKELASWIERSRVDLESVGYFLLRAKRWSANKNAGDLLSWEDAVAFEQLAGRLRAHLAKDQRLETIAPLAIESRRVRGLVASIAEVNFDRLSQALKDRSLTLTEEQAGSSWVFYKAMTDTPAEEDWNRVGNRGFRTAHFAAFANNVTALEAVGGRLELLQVVSEGGWTPLHLAASTGALQAVDLLARAGCSVDDLTKDGWSPLAVAVHTGNLAMVELLLRHRALPTVSRPGELPVLNVAVAGGSLPMVDLLLRCGASPLDADAQQATALHIAAQLDFIEAFVRLSEAQKGQPEAHDSWGESPLHNAARFGAVRILRYLLEEQGANPAAITDPHHLTALHLAAAAGSVPCCALLLEKHPELVTARDVKGDTPLHLSVGFGQIELTGYLLTRRPDLALARNDNEKTPLHMAAERGDADLVRVILGTQPTASRANLATPDKNGFRPVHYAALAGATRVLELLLADYDLSSEVAEVLTTDEQTTPLAIAAARGNRDACVALIALAPSWVGQVDSGLRAPIHYATIFGHLDIAKLLIDAGANACASDIKGYQPLHLACAHRRREIWEHLLALPSINLDAPVISTNATALHLACGPKWELARRNDDRVAVEQPKFEDAPMLRALLTHNPRLDLADNDQATALHYAARNRSVMMATTLLGAGANPDAKDAAGFVPLDRAYAVNNLEFAGEFQWLRRAHRKPAIPTDEAVNDITVEVVAAAGSSLPMNDPRVVWPRVVRLDTEWRDLRGPELEASLADLDAVERRTSESTTLAGSELRGARYVDAPCYPGFRLIELSIAVPEPTGGSKSRIRTFLWSPEPRYSVPGASRSHVVVLAGTSGPFHELNVRLPIELNTVREAQFYVKAFTTYVTGDEGAFNIVDAPEDLPLPDEHARFSWLAITSRVVPMQLLKEESDSFLFLATIVYGRHLYHSQLRVFRWGSVGMEDDVRLFPHPLPLNPDLWRDGYRLLATNRA